MIYFLSGASVHDIFHSLSVFCLKNISLFKIGSSIIFSIKNIIIVIYYLFLFIYILYVLYKTLYFVFWRNTLFGWSDQLCTGQWSCIVCLSSSSERMHSNNFTKGLNSCVMKFVFLAGLLDPRGGEDTQKEFGVGRISHTNKKKLLKKHKKMTKSFLLL